MKALRIWFFKRRVREYYRQYMTQTAHLDCGHAVVQELSPSAYALAAKFDKTAERLRKLDPDMPEFPKLVRI